MEYTIGQSYLIPCAELIFKEDSRVYYVPVFDHPHTDLAFDFPYHHYHIDGRFEIHPRIKHLFRIDEGCTSVIVLVDGTNLYNFNAIVNQELKCTGLRTGLSIPENTIKYENWYNDYIGKTCLGKKCPHLGTEMIEDNNFLICPMHNLTADKKTGLIINRLT